MAQVQIIDAATASTASIKAPIDGNDVIVLHGCSGLDAPSQELASTLAASTTVLVLFPADDPPDVERLISAGVVAAFPQSVEANDLVLTLIAAFDRSERAASWPRPADLPALSRREHEVLGLIAHGLTHQQVARRLKISIHTVDTYVRRIKEKWKLGNKADLTRAAMPMGGRP